jgi:hypothetical protein
MTSVEKWRTTLVIGLVGIFVVVLASVLVRAELTLGVVDIAPALPDGGVMSDSQKKSIDLLVDLSKLFINWTFATIGGVGVFIKLQIESKIALTFLDLLFIFVTLSLCISSLYFAQIGFDIVIRSLSLQQYPFYQSSMFIVFKWQFLLGLSAVCFLGLYAIQYCLARIWSYKDEK